MATIKKDTLHPENEPEVDIYPKTSIDQVENLQANLDALNGDFALLDANNTFSGSNTFSKLTYFNNQIALDINPISFNDDTKNMSLVFNYNGFIKRFVDTGNVYSINIPNKTGTIALRTDIPTLADYPTTIFFNNYYAGIGYKDTSTGTTKTVVSTDNNGAQIVIGDSNTGLTLATNARPKVLDDSTVKEVAYVSDFESKLDKTGGTISGALTITGTSNANIYEVKGSKILDYNSSTTTNEIYGININNIVNNKFEVTKGNIKVSLDMTKVGANDEFALKSNLPNYNSVAGVSYDTTNGAIIYYTNGKLITIPIKAGDGVTIDADETNHNILISAPGGGSSTPQYNRGIDSATPTTFTYELGVYHTLTITLLSTYVSTTIILPNDYDGSSIDIELEGKLFLIMVVAGLLSVRNTTDNTEWVGKLE